MSDRSDLDEIRTAVRAIEPAARLVPRRSLRRAIRLSQDRPTFSDRAVHDRAWWVDRDRLFRALTAIELGLSDNEPPRLLLLAEPIAPIGPQVWLRLWRDLFHAAVDREFEAAVHNGRIDASAIVRLPREIGPAAWDAIRLVLDEENLIEEIDGPETVVREFVSFGSEIIQFRPGDWDVFFPALRPTDEPLRPLFIFTNLVQLFEKTRPGPARREVRSGQHGEQSVPTPLAPTTGAVSGRVRYWSERGNDVRAAIVLERAGDPRAIEYLDRLIERVQNVIDLGADEAAKWRTAVRALLPRAAGPDWPAERRLLYELQRACLAVERPAFAADATEWIITFGRRPIKRELPRTKWVEAHRRLVAAKRYAGRIEHHGGSSGIFHLVEHGAADVDRKARTDLRPHIVAILDEVGLGPASVAERVSRDKLVEELLDGACGRGFLRIGDLRDAIARNRVKLPDLASAREWAHGDPLLRANRLLAVRLEGVYRRGEVYMQALQRGCSLFFGTKPGRLFTRFIALPVGGAFILIEAVRHMVSAGEGLVNWLSGWSATVDAFHLLAGGAAGTLADKPHLGKAGVTWPEWLTVAVLLFLLLHWPAFRAAVVRVTKFVFIKLPRAVYRSPLIHALVANRLTRFIRRYVLTPVAAGLSAGAAVWLANRDWSSAGLVAGGVALFIFSFFRTPLGRTFEDRVDEAASRLWRLVSVNFVLGLLTLILQFFQAVFEAIDGAIYAVDEWLRFRPGQSRAVFVFKVAFGAVWSVATYVFRFAWNLLVEPQINPIKHFPVVTVSHKLLLPLIPSLAKQFQMSEKTMGTIVFGIPGIFGFLVWELKENWKLYRANASPKIRPAVVGSHGETVRALLRPGFHSGVVPKTFAKLRKAVRSQNPERAESRRHRLEHVAEGVHRLLQRSFVPHLRASPGWGGLPIHAAVPLLTPNRILIPLSIGHGPNPTVIALEERGGWVIGAIAGPGRLNELDSVQRGTFESAVAGLYKYAGVHAIREQMAELLGPQAYGFDAVPEGLIIPVPDGKDVFFEYDDGPELISAGRRLPANGVVFSDCPLPWERWAAWWGADAAGKTPDQPLMPGWAILPPESGTS